MLQVGQRSCICMVLLLVLLPIATSQDCDAATTCNGHGTCSSDNGSCICEDGYVGAMCWPDTDGDGIPDHLDKETIITTATGTAMNAPRRNRSLAGTDSGSWTRGGNITGFISSFAASADARVQAATTECTATRNEDMRWICDDPGDPGRIWISHDYGTTWSNASVPASPWSQVAVSSTGQYMVAGTGGGMAIDRYDGILWHENYLRLWYSDNYGASWTMMPSAAQNSNGAPDQPILGLVVSDDGQRIAAVTRVTESDDYNPALLTRAAPRVTGHHIWYTIDPKTELEATMYPSPGCSAGSTISLDSGASGRCSGPSSSDLWAWRSASLPDPALNSREVQRQGFDGRPLITMNRNFTGLFVRLTRFTHSTSDHKIYKLDFLGTGGWTDSQLGALELDTVQARFKAQSLDRSTTDMDSFCGVASSSDGQRVLAVPCEGAIVTSHNGGCSWTTAKSGVRATTFASAAMSDDGMRMAAWAPAPYTGPYMISQGAYVQYQMKEPSQLWLSDDGGETWRIDKSLPPELLACENCQIAKLWEESCLRVNPLCTQEGWTLTPVGRSKRGDHARDLMVMSADGSQVMLWLQTHEQTPDGNVIVHHLYRSPIRANKCTAVCGPAEYVTGHACVACPAGSSPAGLVRHDPQGPDTQCVPSFSPPAFALPAFYTDDPNVPAWVSEAFMPWAAFSGDGHTLLLGTNIALSDQEPHVLISKDGGAWTQGAQTSTGGLARGGAVSQDGQVLVVAVGGGTYPERLPLYHISTDGGSTWSEQFRDTGPVYSYTSNIAMSDDGTVIVVSTRTPCSQGGDHIAVNNNGQLRWKMQDMTESKCTGSYSARNWYVHDVALSGNGQRLYATAYDAASYTGILYAGDFDNDFALGDDQRIYVCILSAGQDGYDGSGLGRSFGCSGTGVQKPRTLASLATSSDGTRIAVVNYEHTNVKTSNIGGPMSHYISISTDSGASWADGSGLDTALQFQDVAMSGDGMTIVAAVSGTAYGDGYSAYHGGHIWVSTDGGSTFNRDASTGGRDHWYRVAMARGTDAMAPMAALSCRHPLSYSSSKQTYEHVSWKCETPEIWVSRFGAGCAAHEHAVGGACVACPAGKHGSVNDDAACEATLCGSGEFVSCNVCLPCPGGTTSAGGHDASGADTTCEPSAELCGVDERVACHACVACEAGQYRLAGDDSSGPDTACGGDMDNDGIPNNHDDDVDGDGLPNELDTYYQRDFNGRDSVYSTAFDPCNGGSPGSDYTCADGVCGCVCASSSSAILAEAGARDCPTGYTAVSEVECSSFAVLAGVAAGKTNPSRPPTPIVLDSSIYPNGCFIFAQSTSISQYWNSYSRSKGSNYQKYQLVCKLAEHSGNCLKCSAGSGSMYDGPFADKIVAERSAGATCGDEPELNGAVGCAAAMAASSDHELWCNGFEGDLNIHPWLRYCCEWTGTDCIRDASVSDDTRVGFRAMPPKCEDCVEPFYSTEGYCVDSSLEPDLTWVSTSEVMCSEPLVGTPMHDPSTGAYIGGCGPDMDGDGIPNQLDDDSDGDGLLNELEGNETTDTDGDGTPDFLDVDDDGDSIPTADEAPDVNGDGVADEPLPDEDGDGIPDVLDADDDGDGVLTIDETKDFAAACSACTATLTNKGHQDTDSDGTPDYLDPDDDGDSRATSKETDVSAYCPACLAEPGPGGREDSDSDGIPNYVDPDDDDDGIPSSEEFQ